jgi:tetratricopeptide (TPR) repeat protein
LRERNTKYWEAHLIQVIPFLAEKEPIFLPLLARGLSDLSALRLNAVGIEAQVNTNLEIKQWDHISHQIADSLAWSGQDLWFSAEVNNVADLSMRVVLFDPVANILIYHDYFRVHEDQFLVAWEQHLLALIGFLNKDIDLSTTNLRMYTKSLEAFLAFRRGLETLSQAKNDRFKEEGLESLLEAVAYDPEFIEATDILLLFLMQNDNARNIDHCISILERLRQIAGQHPRIPLVLAEVYFRWGNKDKAEQTLKELVESFPNFVEGRLRLALFYHTTNQLSDALTTLENILIFEPNEPTALDLMGAIYASQGEPKKAEDVWLKASQADPNRVNVLNNLAILAEENNDLENAEAYYRKALKLSDDWWGSFYHYGTFCWRRERYEEAAILLERARELNPTNFQVFQNLGLVQIELCRYSEAQDSLIQLLQLAPDNTTRRQTLQLLGQLNNPDIQIELRIRQLGQIWETGKHWRVISALVIKYIKARNHWYYWYLWGNILNDIGIKTLSPTFWQIGLRYEPGFPLLKQMGLYYWGKGKYRKALPILRNAYQIHKSDQETAGAYLQTLVNLGEVEELQANVEGLSQLIQTNVSPIMG